MIIIFQLSGKEHKSELEAERERSLMGQWVALTEERTAVSLPSANSDIPGAPCDWFVFAKLLLLQCSLSFALTICLSKAQSFNPLYPKIVGKSTAGTYFGYGP